MGYKISVAAVIDTLADNPRPAPPLGRKLQGKPVRYRLRVSSYRVVDRIDAGSRTVTLTWIGLRRDA